MTILLSDSNYTVLRNSGSFLVLAPNKTPQVSAYAGRELGFEFDGSGGAVGISILPAYRVNINHWTDCTCG